MAEGFNPVEAKLLICMLQNLDGPPTLPVNWKACAKDAGYKNAASARSQWAKVKAREGIGESRTRATNTKRKNDDQGDGQQEGTGSEGATPKKTPNKRSKSAKAVKQAEDNTTQGQAGEGEGEVKAEPEEG